MSEDREREARARARRERMTVRLVPLEASDDEKVTGAEAISLLTKLSRESWALTGKPVPDYDRTQMPVALRPLE